MLLILDIVCHFESGDHFLVTRRIKNIRKKQENKENPHSALLLDLVAVFAAASAEQRSQIAQDLLSKMPEWKGTKLGFHIISYRVLLWLEAVAAGSSLAAYVEAHSVVKNAQ